MVVVQHSVDALLERARAEIERLEPRTAFRRMGTGALLIDIRPIQQRNEHGAIPDALRIERNVLEWRLDPNSPHRIPQVSDHEQPVIVLCQQGYASSFAAASLHALGYRYAADVAGGFEAWKTAGLPVVA